jgi:hypothetical protein
VAGFVLTAPQELRARPWGAPRPDRQDSDRESWNWHDDERTTWLAAAWILDTHSREVVSFQGARGQPTLRMGS